MFKCPICNKTFKYLFHLKCHFTVKHKHKILTEGKCPICEYRGNILVHLSLANDEKHSILYYLITNTGGADKYKRKLGVKYASQYLKITERGDRKSVV